jgi:heat shock protein HtpX
MELSMTHPLPAKRIQALGKVASELGQVPFIEFDLKQPETYWDDFLGDVLARGAWAFSIPLAILVFWWYSPLGWVSFLLALASFLTVAPLLGIAYLRLYKYPGGFKGARIKDLLEDPKASPVRGTPVELTGRIIGRGVPGLFYSEDIKMDDGTGIILLDYNQVLGIINFFVGVFQTPDWLDRPVVARGWYRRRVVPYVELLEMTVGDRKHHLWNPGAQVALCLIVLLFGIWVDILAIGAL